VQQGRSVASLEERKRAGRFSATSHPARSSVLRRSLRLALPLSPSKELHPKQVSDDPLNWLE
jgi:hypothetical protein